MTAPAIIAAATPPASAAASRIRDPVLLVPSRLPGIGSGSFLGSCGTVLSAGVTGAQDLLLASS